MSTDYTPSETFPIVDLFDGRMGPLEEAVHDVHTNERMRFLTDGENSVCAHAKEDGSILCISRYGANDPTDLLSAIAKQFGVQFTDDSGIEFEEEQSNER